MTALIRLALVSTALEGTTNAPYLYNYLDAGIGLQGLTWQGLMRHVTATYEWVLSVARTSRGDTALQMRNGQ